MSNDITGQFLTSKYDIILGKDIATYLFPNNDALGQNVYFTDGTNETIELSVVAINNTLNASAEYLNFVSNEVVYD